MDADNPHVECAYAPPAMRKRIVRGFLWCPRCRCTWHPRNSGVSVVSIVSVVFLRCPCYLCCLCPLACACLPVNFEQPSCVRQHIQSAPNISGALCIDGWRRRHSWPVLAIAATLREQII